MRKTDSGRGRNSKDGRRGFCDNVLLTAVPPPNTALTLFEHEDISSHKIQVDQQGVQKSPFVEE